MRYLIPIIFTLIVSTHLFGQEVFSTTGDYNANAQGSLSWTIGEVVTETFVGGSNTLTQGFQQNYEDLLVIDELTGLISFDVFPNPFSGDININAPDDIVSFNVTVRDYQSKEIYNETIAMIPGIDKVSINLHHLAPGCYFVTMTVPQIAYTVTKRMIKISTHE